MRAPRCYYGATDPQRARFVLMLEDLADVEFGDQVGGGDDAKIVKAVIGLASHHAKFWNSLDIAGLSQQHTDGTDPRLLVPLFTELLGEIDETFGKGLPLTHSVAGLIVQSMDMPSFEPPSARLPDPFTLVHTDYRLDNLGFDAGGDLVVIDWCCQPGSPHGDLAYFLSGNMLPDQIEDRWDDMVHLYHQTLTTKGVDNYGLTQLEEGLRGQIAEQTMAIVTGLGILSRRNRYGNAGDLSTLPAGIHTLIDNLLDDPRGFEIIMGMAERTEAALGQVMPGGSIGATVMAESLRGIMSLKAHWERWRE